MPIIRDERDHAIAGVSGTMFASTTRPDEPAGLFSSQKWISESRTVSGYGVPALINVQIRFDDECGNRHNTFAITATVRAENAGNRRDPELASGCLHDEIAQVFPELFYLIKWHLTSSDGPMHYIANTLYLAGDRDHWGLRKDERAPLKDREGSKLWELKAENSEGIGLSDTPTGRQYANDKTVPLFVLQTRCKGDTPPIAAPKLVWVQSEQIGEGKKRDLDAARRSAVWPEATDADLMQEPDALRVALEARHTSLMQEFKRDITEAGFLWSPETVNA